MPTIYWKRQLLLNLGKYTNIKRAKTRLRNPYYNWMGSWNFLKVFPTRSKATPYMVRFQADKTKIQGEKLNASQLY
jgi:hypothetical protein